MTPGRDELKVPGRSESGVAETTAPDDGLTVTHESFAAGPAKTIGVWGGLKLIEQIGRGSFGTVYRAWEDALAREVALKIITLPRQDPEQARIFLREGQMLARVRHQNVVTVYGAQHHGNEIGIWMEFIRGRRLSDLVKDEGPLGADEAMLVGISLSRALAAVHGAGLLHRDLKAHNVMREEGGRIVLMDFGAGRDRSVSPAGGDYSGTPLYMAPELLAGRSASPASDIYSLGVLLYFLVTGAYPVEGRTAADLAVAHGLGRRVHLADRRADLPDRFVRVVERALNPLPSARYGSAGGLLQGLSDALGGSGHPLHLDASARREPPVESAAGTAAVPEPQRRPIQTWALAAAVAAAAAGMLGLLTSAAFDLTLGRSPEFVNESTWERLSYGPRSLVAPAFYAGAFVVVVHTVAAVLRLVSKLIPGFKRLARRASGAVAASGVRDARALAQLIVVLQVAALALVIWQFGDLLRATTTNLVNEGPASLQEALSPGNPERKVYRAVLAILITAMVLVWWRLLTSPAPRPPDRTATTAGAVVILIALVMMSVPYRLLFHSAFERVDYSGQRCYIIGQRPRETPIELLLFCRDAAPPRNRIVRSDDARLQRPRSFPEDIFADPVR